MNKQEVRVFLQGDCFGGDIRLMLARYDGKLKFRPSKTIEASDIVMYAGGADISPQLYNQVAIHGVYCDERQDKSDIECFKLARRTQKFQVGICRGAQLLNVMNGGRLWQDVNNHAGKAHLVQDCLSKKTFFASSLHHQQCILPLGNSTVELLAFCNESTEKKSYGSYWKGLQGGHQSTDIEAFWYPSSKCLGVQWHPEIGPDECVTWFFEYIERFYKPEVKEEAA